MTDKRKPLIAVITGIVLAFGIVCTVPFFSLFGIIIYPGWAVCVGLLFLCEYLFKRKKRGLFTVNIGAFIATAIMIITFISWTVIETSSHTGGLIDFSELEQQLYCFIFLPPIIVSTVVNIVNLIYKIGSGISK